MRDSASLRILYYFDRFGRPVSHGEWPWPKSVGCPASQRRWPSLKGQKIGQIFKISAGRPNSGQVLAEILHLSQGIFKLANAKISATHVPCPTPGRIDRNSTVEQIVSGLLGQSAQMSHDTCVKIFGCIFAHIFVRRGALLSCGMHSTKLTHLIIQQVYQII